MSQLNLLRRRRFWPLFWTQFFGAFNDNVFKNALVILITYQAWSIGSMAPQTVVAMSAGIFILPFFLFSAIAGQLSDRLAKARLMRWVKAGEIVIMVAAALGFLFSSLPVLLGVLFLMGSQSAFFGPAKYSILPELLEEDELVGGNALVETGTFIAILLGTILGGVLIAMGTQGTTALSGTVVAVAFAGWGASLFIQVQPASAPELSVQLDPVRPLLETFRVTRQNRPVFLSILGISWFWFLGASFLTVLPTYVNDVLGAGELSVTFFLALFCVGISVGSLLCEKMSARVLELGLVPFGSFGMSVFALDLFLVGYPQGLIGAEVARMSVGELLATPGTLRVAVDLALLAIFSGFYTVPLYTMIQQRTERATRSRVIAGNNILNALFMVASSLTLMGWYARGLTIPQMFLLLATMNAVVAIYIYTVIPEFLLRFVVWMLAGVMYRLKVTGRERLPVQGPAVLVCNHVSFVDWLIIASACRQPVRFVMHHTFMTLPVVGFLFRDAKVIPIAPAHEDADTLAAAFDTIAAELEAKEIVCIFPEGKITRDGRMNVFRTGIERILARTPAPVIPMAIDGMWGSFFSRKDDAALSHPFRRFWSRVRLTVGEPLEPEGLTAERLGEIVAALGGFEPPAAVPPVAPSEGVLESAPLQSV